MVVKIKPKIKIYIAEYDLQGEEQDVPNKALENPEEYEKFKHKCIKDFVNKYKIYFKEHGVTIPRKDYFCPSIDKTISLTKSKTIKGYDFDRFGTGTYRDTYQNRKLGRVGQPYDKAIALKQKIEKIIRTRQLQVEEKDIVKFPKTPKSVINIDKQTIGIIYKPRKWSMQDEEFIIQNYTSLSNKALAERLMRTSKAISEKARRLRKFGFVSIIKKRGRKA